MVACSGEGYRNRQDCLRMIRKLFPMIEPPAVEHD